MPNKRKSLIRPKFGPDRNLPRVYDWLDELQMMTPMAEVGQ